ncbi:MAG: D-alanyl-D-alanine carboxypeptidase [Clostridia bacterium]|nr:D-alanyl-D-alanine carboxypeptidase [Clostridia bacterium]
MPCDIRRPIALFCCFLLFASLALGGVSFAETAAPASVDTRSAKAVLLIDEASGKLLYELNAAEKLPAAGLTRLAALLVICDAFDGGLIDGSAQVTVDDTASRIGGTTAFLRSGEQIEASALLLAAAMINAGDATHALACAAFGGESNAVAAINARLAGLGVDAVYSDICGSGQRFSAVELAAIAGELIKSQTYLKYGTKYYEHLPHENAGETELANPNKLIKQYSGCLGVGTGSSSEAGYCGVFAARRGESGYIATVLGAGSGAERFETGRDLLDHGFSAYRSIRVSAAGEGFGSIPVKGSLVRQIGAEAGDDTFLLISTVKKEYTLEPALAELLEAPIKRGDAVGMLTVRGADGEVLAETVLVSDRDAPESGFLDCARLIMRRFIGLETEEGGEE